MLFLWVWNIWDSKLDISIYLYISIYISSVWVSLFFWDPRSNELELVGQFYNPEGYWTQVTSRVFIFPKSAARMWHKYFTSNML